MATKRQNTIASPKIQRGAKQSDKKETDPVSPPEPRSANKRSVEQKEGSAYHNFKRHQTQGERGTLKPPVLCSMSCPKESVSLRGIFRPTQSRPEPNTATKGHNNITSPRTQRGAKQSDKNANQHNKSSCTTFCGRREC